MERLPLRFEKEVLLPELISRQGRKYIQDTPQEWFYVTDYEIAARGLEAMRDWSIYKYANGNKWCIENTYDKETLSENKDFCECVFKAIREIYKEVESEGE